MLSTYHILGPINIIIYPVLWIRLSNRLHRVFKSAEHITQNCCLLRAFQKFLLLAWPWFGQCAMRAAIYCLQKFKIWEYIDMNNHKKQRTSIEQIKGCFSSWVPCVKWGLRKCWIIKKVREWWWKVMSYNYSEWFQNEMADISSWISRRLHGESGISVKTEILKNEMPN